MSDDLPPLPKRRQIQISRYRLKMARGDLEWALKDMQRQKDIIAGKLDNLCQLFEQYRDAAEEYMTLTERKHK